MIRRSLDSIVRFLFLRVLPVFLVLAVPFLGYFVWTEAQRVRRAFGERNWSVPSRVYARSVELYPGRTVDQSDLTEKLRDRQYVRADTPDQPGEYSSTESGVTVHLRSFRFPDGSEPARTVHFDFSGSAVDEIRRPDSDTATLDVVRLEPLRIGSFFSHRYEDWVPLTYDEIPPLLRKTLIEVEDQRFRDHAGLDLIGILRAMTANILAGEIVQGGSTLTQQLVKNRFLGNQRTLRRKAREALLALLTEWYFDKETILQAYVNEVYMGQLGKKSIQGFGKAGRYYFGVPVRDLTPGQTATLVGLIRGPSVYNPRRNPDLARKRRNFVLERMEETGFIDGDEYRRSRDRPLRLAPRESVSLTPYPDFLELVKRRLRRDFPDRELNKRGLRVFTTLVPETQEALQESVRTRLDRLNERSADPEKPLQAAMVSARVRTGEVTGLVGGRRIGYPGFNRALSPRRSVGSVIKPAVYLTALKQPDRYSLLTRIRDEAFSLVPEGDTQPWGPTNYNDTFHGNVPLVESLTHSYNVGTTRLGLELGYTEVFETLRELGLEEEFKSHPSVFLGTSSLSPLEVTQMYQTLAGRGYHAPLKAVRGVLTPEGESIRRNPLELRRTVDPAAVYTVNNVLKRVTRVGTARSLREQLPSSLELAGKTGTTQRYRDSWFSGFSRNRVMTVWVGHDDDSPTGLSGAGGALKLWGEAARRLNVRSIRSRPPEGVEMVPVDTESWWPSEGRCENEVRLPFVEGSRPDTLAPCAATRTFPFF